MHREVIPPYDQLAGVFGVHTAPFRTYCCHRSLGFMFLPFTQLLSGSLQVERLKGLRGCRHIYERVLRPVLKCALCCSTTDSRMRSETSSTLPQLMTDCMSGNASMQLPVHHSHPQSLHAVACLCPVSSHFIT